MGERGQLIVTVFEVIGVYPSSGQGQPETFCMLQLDDRQPARTKPIKVSDRQTNHRPGFEVKISDVDERTHKFRIGIWKQLSPEPVFLGHVKLELQALPPNKMEEHTLKIKKSKGKGAAKGGLHFALEYRPPAAPVDHEKKRKDNVFGDKFRGFSILSGGHHPKKHKRVFGQPPDAQRAEVPPQLQCPLSALDQRNYHTTEGIFRISAPASEVEALKELYETGKDIQWASYDAHVLACVIVNYLLNLPEPLTSFELYDSLISAYETGEDINVKKAFMKKLLATLPPGYKACMELLMTYLAKVASFTSVNKMTSKNLGIVFGPALLRRRTETPQQIIRDSPIVIEIVTLMVENVPAFFKGQELASAPPVSTDVVMDDTSPRVPPITPSPRRNTGGPTPAAVLHSSTPVPPSVMLAPTGPLAAPAWARTNERKQPAAAGAPAAKPAFMQLGKTGIRGASPQKPSTPAPAAAGGSTQPAEVKDDSAAAAHTHPNNAPAEAPSTPTITNKDADDALMQVENLLRSKEAEARPEIASPTLTQSTTLLSASQTGSNRLSASRRGSRGRLEWSRLNQTRNRLTARINSFGHLEAEAEALALAGIKQSHAGTGTGGTAPPAAGAAPSGGEPMQVDMLAVPPAAAHPPSTMSPRAIQSPRSPRNNQAAASAATTTSAESQLKALGDSSLNVSMLLPVADMQFAVAEDVSFSRKNTAAIPEYLGGPPPVPTVDNHPPVRSSPPSSGKHLDMRSGSPASSGKNLDLRSDSSSPASSGKNLELKGEAPKSGKKLELKEQSKEKVDMPPKPLSGKNLEVRNAAPAVDQPPLGLSGKNATEGSANNSSLKDSSKSVSKPDRESPPARKEARDEPPLPLRTAGKGGSGIMTYSTGRGSRPGVAATAPVAPLPDVYAFLAEGKSAEPASVTTSGRKPVDAVKATDQTTSRRSDPPLPLQEGTEAAAAVGVAASSPEPARGRAMSASTSDRLSTPPLPSGVKLPQPIDAGGNRKRTDSRGTAPTNLPPPPTGIPRVATPPHNRMRDSDKGTDGMEPPSITMLKGPSVPGRNGSPLPSVLPSGSVRVGQVGAPSKTALRGQRDSADAPPRALRPIAPDLPPPSPLAKPTPPAAVKEPAPAVVSEEDDLLVKMRTIISASVQDIIDTTATVTARIADGTFYDVISCSHMLKSLKRLLDDGPADDLQGMLLDHAQPHPPRPNLRDPATAKRFNQFCTIAGVTLSELVANLSQMSKELDADMLVMERSEVLANAANLARLVRDVRTVLDNFVSYTLRSNAPAPPKSLSSTPAQKQNLRKEIEQSGDLISTGIHEELARLASVEEAVAFTKMVKNARQLLAERNPQQSLFLERVEKPAISRRISTSALEVTRLETTVDMARYSVSAVATEIIRLVNDSHLTEDLQELTNLVALVKNVELYIREYTEAIQVTEEEEEEEESPPEREGPSTNELPDEDEEQLALLQRTAANVLSSIQQDLTQLRMELEVHGADPGYEGRILQIAKIASLIKKLMEGTPLSQEWKQIIDGTPYPGVKQDLSSLVRLSVSLFDQARGWLFEQRQELARADLSNAIVMAQGLSQVAKVAEWYRRQYSTP